MNSYLILFLTVFFSAKLSVANAQDHPTVDTTVTIVRLKWRTSTDPNIGVFRVSNDTIFEKRSKETFYEKSKTTIGFELLGIGGFYSVVFNKSILHKKQYNLELRSQITIFPGSVESEIPNYFAPYIGLNHRFGNKKLCFVVNTSIGVGLTWGTEAYSPKFISGITLGPKFRTNFVILGIGYTYFLFEPEYMYIRSFPHSLAISFEFELGQE